MKGGEIVDNTLARFRAHAPPIMEEEIAKNNLRWRTTIFNNRKPLHTPMAFKIKIIILIVNYVTTLDQTYN
jgi:hypothetical protein